MVPSFSSHTAQSIEYTQRERVWCVHDVSEWVRERRELSRKGKPSQSANTLFSLALLSHFSHSTLTRTEERTSYRISGRSGDGMWRYWYSYMDKRRFKRLHVSKALCFRLKFFTTNEITNWPKITDICSIWSSRSSKKYSLSQMRLMLKGTLIHPQHQ